MLKILNYKNIFILFIYLIIIIYSLEILLFILVDDDQKSLVNIKEKRIQIAKKKNLNYDIRHPVEAYLEEKANNKNLYIPFYLNKSYYNISFVKNLLNKNKIIPFRGPVKKQTLSCDEALNFKLINNDRYGFKNPDYVYEDKIEILVLGDSYAEGLCEDEKNDISGHLRDKKYNSINLGVTGSGPLTSLAIIREYIEYFKPNYVVYLYFEGNDLHDLNWEKQTHLINYLNDDFKRDYYNLKDDIKATLEEFQKYRISQLDQIDLKKNLKEKNNNKNNFIQLLKDIVELQNLKGIIRSTILFNDQSYDTKLFFDIVKKINFEVISNDSELIFIYLPSWSRYFEKFHKNQFIYKKKKEIIGKLKKKYDIKIIDFEEILSSKKNKKKYFPLEFVGHYNSDGYKLLANEIINFIN